MPQIYREYVFPHLLHFPYLFFVQKGRDLDALHSFVSDKAWADVEPLAWYRQPNSILMSAVSTLFIFSANMQIFHEYLTDELGVNEYASYAIYIVLTVVLGLVLGGIMVCISDMIQSSRRRKLVHQQKKYDPPAETAPDSSADLLQNPPEPKEESTTRRRVRKE